MRRRTRIFVHKKFIFCRTDEYAYRAAAYKATLCMQNIINRKDKCGQLRGNCLKLSKWYYCDLKWYFQNNNILFYSNLIWKKTLFPFKAVDFIGSQGQLQSDWLLGMPKVVNKKILLKEENDYEKIRKET